MLSGVSIFSMEAIFDGLSYTVVGENREGDKANSAKFGKDKAFNFGNHD